MLFPAPPVPDLPDPSLYQRIQVEMKHKVAGFEHDVANMFHNVVLPLELALCFPFQSVVFGDLPGNAQRSTIEGLKLSQQPKQNKRFRPFQKTLPMGFTWAVWIAHTVAS